MAKALGLDILGKSKEEVAQLFVDELYVINRDLNVKCDLKDVGVTIEVIDSWVEGAPKVTRLLNNNPKELSKAEMHKIYEKLLVANS